MLRFANSWRKRLPLLLLPLAFAGCSNSNAGPAPTANSAPPAGAPVPPPPTQPGDATSANDPNAAFTNLAAALGGSPVTESATPEPPATERIKAEVGVGI